MKVQSGEFIVELTSEDCFQIGIAFEHAIEKSIKEHWIYYPSADWKKEDKKRIEYMTRFLVLAQFESEARYFLDRMDKQIQEGKK